MKKNIFFILLLVTFAFAAKPVPFEYNKVRILYVIDSFDDEKVEAVLPRSVLDSILLDVDSVFFAPLGACDCACAGGDIFFYLSKKKILEPFSRQISLTAFVVKLATAWTKKIEDDDDDVDDSRLIFILDSTIKAENKRKSR